MMMMMMMEKTMKIMTTVPEDYAHAGSCGKDFARHRTGLEGGQTCLYLLFSFNLIVTAMVVMRIMS